MATSPGSARYDLVDLDQDLPGQRRFISCWLGRDEGVTFIVDPGPPSTADKLVAALGDLGVTHLDLVLLTHVHLDHGGCTARILERWPEARVVAHPRGRPHLADPSRLWEGSRQVLGRKAEVYGEPAPVPASALADYDAAAAHGIGVIDTPGHAPHHVAFTHGDGIFLGECAGTFSALGQGPASRDYYLRPATPPRFRLETAEASLDRVLALDPFPSRLFFAHHGEHTAEPRALLEAARRQLRLWVDTVRGVRDGLAALPHTEQPADEAAFLERLVAALAANDPVFARGAGLPADIREREADFTRQTLRGMLGYLRDNAPRA